MQELKVQSEETMSLAFPAVLQAGPRAVPELFSELAMAGARPWVLDWSGWIWSAHQHTQKVLHSANSLGFTAYL